MISYIIFFKTTCSNFYISNEEKYNITSYNFKQLNFNNWKHLFELKHHAMISVHNKRQSKCTESSLYQLKTPPEQSSLYQKKNNSWTLAL